MTYHTGDKHVLIIIIMIYNHMSKHIDLFLQIEVLISDINDNPPIFNPSTYNITLSESMLVGTVVLNLLATDRDHGNNASLLYSILHSSVPNNSKFLITGNLAGV